ASGEALNKKIQSISTRSIQVEDMAYTSSRSSSSSSSDSEVDSCSKTCMKAYADLREQYKNEAVFTEKINVLNLEVKLRDKVLAEYTTNLEKAEKKRDELKLTLEKLQKELHAPKRDLRLIDEHFESEYVDVSTVSSSDVKTVKTVDHKGVFSKEEPKPVRKNSFGPPIIEDWRLDNESEEEISPTVEIQVSNGLGLEKSITSHLKIGTSTRISSGEDDASKQGRNLKQRSIFEERYFDVQAMMDADYELAARLRAEE
nr:hypothetical protein [Tanacetum cinerariifolium]